MEPHQRTASLLANNLTFLLPLVVSPNNSAKSDNTKSVQYLQALATAAKDTAFAHACSSVLAGQGSEADDLEDIGFWLGKGQYDRENAENVMKSLGLQGEIHFEPLSEQSGLPAAFKGDGGKVTEELKRLKDKYCARISIPGQSTVVYVLVGRLSDDDGWGGLVGAGVWSDGLS